MRQRVQITTQYPDGTAEVAMTRQSACAGDCRKCGGCASQTQTIQVRAKNEIGASVGDWVYVEAETKVVFSAVFLLYLVPIVLFFVGYFLGPLTPVAPGYVALVGFALGMLPVFLYDKYVAKRRLLRFRITGLA